jgi:putative peptide maturation dehydrogenase
LPERARRAAHVFLTLSDERVPDIARLVRGEVELVPQTQLLALSVLTGRERAITPDDLRVLEGLSADRWTEVADIPLEAEKVQSLALDGLLVCDPADEELADLRRRDEQLREIGWNPYAALYHSLTSWRDVDVGPLFESVPDDLERPGRPPPHFHRAPKALETFELPLARTEESLFALLSQRRTTRAFDPGQPLTADELATLLDYTFGCHGYARVGEDAVLLRKTSPSGGSLHAVEAYPLVVEVDGIEPGLYHYRVDLHALDLLERMSPGEARDLLVEFAAGQSYLASAQVLIVLTARFSRSYWKYRANSRAYAVLLMDAAHLSQTLYLVCAQLGLGAFVTAAVNGGNIEDRLGLDGLEEGVLAACGCGRPAPGSSEFDLEFEPYVPRETSLGD